MGGLVSAGLASVLGSPALAMVLAAKAGKVRLYSLGCQKLEPATYCGTGANIRWLTRGIR